MTVPYARYELQGGYLDHWLVAGPLATPVLDLERYGEEQPKLEIARRHYEPEPGVTRPPVELDTFEVGDESLRWQYYRCRDDHFVDLTAFYHTCHYLRAWAYARLECAADAEVGCVLTTNGPADLWLNGEHVHRQEHFHHQIPHRETFRVTLKAGANDLLVRFEEVATRECPYAMALQFLDLPGEVSLLLPVANDDLERREALERAFDAAYVAREVYVWDEPIEVRWPEDRQPSVRLAVRLQTPAGRIYGEALRRRTDTDPVRLLRPYEFPEGRYYAMVMPHPTEYHARRLRIRRRIPLWAVRSRYSQSAYGTYEERRREALLDAARREENVFSEIAKMALGYWKDVKTEVVLAAIESINRRADCSDFYLVGLLGMMQRFGADPSFPEALKAPLEECVLNFRYWLDEPGSDAMCFWSENHQILFHACEVLAGQLYPDRTFSNAGQTGQWHREKGERLALSWLRKRATGGFREWDSNCYFEEDLLALSHLADLAETQAVYDLAAVVTDKMLFSIALNSFKGAFGSTHGRTYAQLIKGARLEATAGISRLLWGLGAFNSHILGTVSLACAQDYELPATIAQIALDQPEAMWNRERHAGEMEDWCDRATGPWEVNKVTYKTPDYMLCSAQDYHPGEAGYQQHIWQATLSPDAVVFVTHPPCLSEEGSHRPNCWHGNVLLPRVAQWHDALIAIHRLPPDDWLGFTHAYFPLAAFDEHALREGWAFARLGEGYLALTAACGLELATRGDNAYRELRSYGRDNVWLCQMGQAALDGSFAEFQDKVLALAPQYEGPSVRFPTLRGQTLAFGWEGPLRIDGEEQPITGFKHYESPYCVAELPASQMDIQYGGDILRLNLSDIPEGQEE